MSDYLSSVLLRTSVEGGILIGLLWVAGRALPRLPAGVRATLWWLASLKLIVGLAWPVPFELAVLPAAPAPLVAVDVSTAVRMPELPTRTSGAKTHASETRHRGLKDEAIALARPVAVLVWLGVVVAFGVRILRQWQQTRRIVRGSRPAAPGVRRGAAVAARTMRVGTVDVRVSPEVVTPQVTGIRRPIVLVPSAFECLPDAEQQMVLCHELAHVRRGDLWMGIVPALAQRLFFFHPLASFAAREYHTAREAACDAAVLQTLGVAAGDYGRLLLTMGVARTSSFAPATASRSLLTLKRRLSMLPTHTRTHAGWRMAGWAATAFTALAVLPVTPVTASPQGEPHERARSSVAPVLAPASAVRDPHRTSPVLAPATPAPRGSSLAQAPPASKGSRREAEESWVLFRDGDRMSMSGWGSDRPAAERHRTGSEPLLWFRRAGQEYVVRDPAVVQRAAALFAPLEALGAEMGALGGKQGELGARQGEWGARQGAVGSRQGALGARQGELGAKLGAVQARRARPGISEQERAALEKESAAIEADMERLSGEMETLGREMEKLGEPMEDLGRQMQEYGTQMDALGKKMEAAGKQAESEMRTLMDEAVSNGLAQKVH